MVHSDVNEMMFSKLELLRTF